MRHAVRTDLVPGREPLANLAGVHQFLRRFPRGNIPNILLADSPRHNELNRAKTGFAQRIERVFQSICKSVVESNRHGSRRSSGIGSERIQAFTLPAGGVQLPELRAKQRGAYIQPFETRAAWPRPELVISEDRKAASEKIAKRSQRCVIGSFDARILATLEDERQQVGGLLLREFRQQPFRHQRLPLAV